MADIGISLGPSIGIGIGAGIGAAGGMGAGAAVGAASAAGSAQAVGATGTATANPVAPPSPSSVVQISEGAMKALNEEMQVGANFSVSQDASGHKYVGGMDSNGFTNPGPSDAFSNVQNGNGQSYQDLNGGQDWLVAATLMLSRTMAQAGEKAAAMEFGINTKSSTSAYTKVGGM